jgi:hypothetical protein
MVGAASRLDLCALRALARSVVRPLRYINSIRTGWHLSEPQDPESYTLMRSKPMGDETVWPGGSGGINRRSRFWIQFARSAPSRAHRRSERNEN